MSIQLNLESADVTWEWRGRDAQDGSLRRLVIKGWDAPEDGSQTVYIDIPVGLTDAISALLVEARPARQEQTWREIRQSVIDAIVNGPATGSKFNKILRTVCLEATMLEQVLNTVRLEGTVLKEGMDTYRMAGLSK